MTTRLRLLIAGVLAGGIFTAACAQADPENNVATPAESGSASPTPRLSVVPSATPTKQIPGGEITLTGLVERIDLEGGCLVLKTDSGKTYEIKGGDPAVVKAGARVSITGKIRSDLMTVCQVGPVLEVISSQPA